MVLDLELSFDLDQTAGTRDFVHDVVIIGGGPAGLSAAIYAARAGLSTVVIDMNPRAGALGMTSKIANYPGIPETMTGPELLERFRTQAASFGAEFVRAQVVTTDLASETKKIHTAEGTYQARTVVIATGSMGRKPSLEGEADLTGRGVSYCAACDAAFFKGADVAVIGNMDLLQDELDMIAQFARTVHLIPRGRPTEEQVAAATVLEHVQMWSGARVRRIVGDRNVTGVELTQGGETKQLPVSGVFLYMQGNKPSVQFLDGSLDRTDDGCIAVNRDDASTSHPGVFAVGDVTCKDVRQVVVAAAEGATAALAADRYVRQAKRVRPQWD